MPAPNGNGGRLLFAEWSCEEGSDPHEFENWKRSNPSLGVHGIAPVEFLREDYEVNMSLQQFAREHLGMWDDPAMSSIIPFELWNCQECLTEESPESGDITVCVDVAPDRAWGSIAVAQMWPDKSHHVEVIENQNGTNWILPAMQKLIASSNPPKLCVVQVGAKAGEFGPELEQIGYRVEYFGTQDIAHATSQFERDIEGHKLSHLDDPILKAGLGGATKYPIGNADFVGAWGWLRKNTSVDITGIVACSYASRALTLFGVEETLTRKKKYRMA